MRPPPRVARFVIHGSLRRFLGLEHRSGRFTASFARAATVKDAIESLGVPHPEIDGIEVNGTPVGFGRILGAGDRVEVYPWEERTAARRPHLIPEPPRPARFLLDVHLSRLSRYLRLLGFDAADEADDPVLAERSVLERRILLTRDIGLLKRSIVRHGYFVRETDPRRQIVEVANRYGLVAAAAPFTRCMACNGILRDASPDEVAGRLEAGTRRSVERFRTCDGCDRVYWEGPHHRRLSALVARVLADAG